MVRPDEALEMQRCGDDTMEGPGLDHPGKNNKERPKQNNSKMRRKESKLGPLQGFNFLTASTNSI